MRTLIPCGIAFLVLVSVAGCGGGGGPVDHSSSLVRAEVTWQAPDNQRLSTLARSVVIIVNRAGTDGRDVKVTANRPETLPSVQGTLAGPVKVGTWSVQVLFMSQQDGQGVPIGGTGGTTLTVPQHGSAPMLCASNGSVVTLTTK